MTKSVEVHRGFWRGIRLGLSVADAAAGVGASGSWGSYVFGQAGGVNPFPAVELKGRYLSHAEREEIMRLDAQGVCPAQIAAELGRHRSTICRELARGSTSHHRYRASAGQRLADRSRRTKRARKLAMNLPLRAAVIAGLKRHDSPEQIAGRLRREFPDDLEMRVCAETIYQSLYIQGRGGLKRELAKHLRTGRWMRKPRRNPGSRRGRIPNMIMIADRPEHINKRDIPGHWEGDLIMGSTASGSAVGTLVERVSGFVMLLHLPNGHTALAVQEALIKKISSLPEQLRLSLTWDQGSEMSNHVQIRQATGIDIYFCDPHSPWQRGSNENTNGLLRQYLPKGTDLSFHGPGLLDKYAAELNSRPRKRHDYATPAEVLNELISKDTKHNSVA